MNSPADAIRITKLVKQYGNVTAVDNLSLRVPAGTMFGFLGPNGSGKSTTIGCLTGLLDPSSGEIEILGERFSSEASSLKRRMGVMPETLGLFEPLYAHEFLAFIHSPEVLFLDEPFESIDPAGVALMKQWLRRFTEQGRTVFITTHVLDTVERLCQRVAIITKPGKLMWEGDITALAGDGSIEFEGRKFHALEPLFLQLTGEKYADLKWL